MTDKLKYTLGLRVQAARKRAGLTQEELAASIRRTPESISNIERGQQLPTIETLADLGRVLSVPITDFLDGIAAPSSISPERQRLEAQLREIARSLADRDLAIALGILEVLKRGRSSR
jgi:transcriptional regulator with XRE-family HTH domain